MATATRRTLTPVTITERYPSFRAGRWENWAAASVEMAEDGKPRYEYHRLEMTGTPWEVVVNPGGRDGGWYGSLPRAREATAAGWAMAHAEQQVA